MKGRFVKFPATQDKLGNPNPNTSAPTETSENLKFVQELDYSNSYFQNYPHSYAALNKLSAYINAVKIHANTCSVMNIQLSLNVVSAA
jgi:hypothetical protein